MDETHISKRAVDDHNHGDPSNGEVSKPNSDGYKDRSYLSVGEVAAYTGLSVDDIHSRVRMNQLPAYKSTSGQYRFRLQDIAAFRKDEISSRITVGDDTSIERNQTAQRVILGDSRRMTLIPDSSVHLAITSPPYFDAKMYSESNDGDLGNVHNLEEWVDEITEVWREVFRVLQPGRKFFLNIMNLPVRENSTFRSLNLVGNSIDMCEQVGFIFKRDIVWHKTNGVRAHFGTYPYPGGILLNNMHESILEFEKPAPKGAKKYAHVGKVKRESSKLDKEFWLSLKNTDVWLIAPEKSGGRRTHTAPFPLEIPSRLIRAYSFIGETVLDPFLGSGTTLVAAVWNQRNGVGYEINSDFCDMSVKRLREMLI